MTKPELFALMKSLKVAFDEVRLVDPNMKQELAVSATGDIVNTPHKCFHMLDKEHCCKNCISAKALAQKNRLTKFELLDGTVYCVTSKYLEVEGQPYILEMMLKMSHETLFSAFGRTEFAHNLLDITNTLYTDPLTGAFNRRFFEEQFTGLENHCAVAFLDLDHFKNINDTYGHDAGDQTLKTVVQAILKNVRADDAVIRYGGEEFVISFAQMPASAFVKRLQDLRAAVKRIVIPEYPFIKVTVSIGGLYCQNGDRMMMVKEADQLCYEAKRTRDDVQVKIRYNNALD